MRTVVALGLGALLAACAFGCRRKPVEQRPAPSVSASVPTSVTSAPAPSVPPLRLERFVAARGKGADVELAAVTRERTVVFGTLGPDLAPRAGAAPMEVLARDVEATDGTELALVAEGWALFVGKIGGRPNVWLLRSGSAPTAIARDRCVTRDGVAWLARDGTEVVVKLARPRGDAASRPVAVPLEHEVHLQCGPDVVALTSRDGEHLAAATFAVDALAEPTALVELERDGELDDEPRERVVLPRAGRALVVLRVGQASVSLRELEGAAPDAWRKLVRDGKPFALREDVDLVGAAAAPDARGRVWFLVSEPIVAGASCADGEPPRRIVLHEVDGKGDVSSRPVLELPCGVEAIDAHLRSDRARATMWWTEPVDAKGCPHPGLSASALVTAQSDQPGARRAPMLAEGIFALEGAERFLAVVRPGGCVAPSAPGAGQLVGLPAPK